MQRESDVRGTTTPRRLGYLQNSARQFCLMSKDQADIELRTFLDDLGV
jgi:hypothetical protein